MDEVGENSTSIQDKSLLETFQLVEIDEVIGN